MNIAVLFNLSLILSISILSGFTGCGEDDESLRMLFSEALKQQGYSVIDACDGEESLRCLADSSPLVSALVSTCNSEEFTEGCPKDLLSQSIADRLEIIVIDSGSRQREGDIVRDLIL